MTLSPEARSDRNLKVYMSVHVLDLLGLWIHRVALGWLTWELTASEFWVGIVAFCQFFPIVIFSPIFGVLADQLDRKKVAVVLNVVMAALALVMAASSFAGLLDIRLICILSILQGIAAGGYSPVRMTLVANLVTRDRLGRAVALNSLVFNASRFIGPVLAGLIIAGWGVSWAFAYNAASYLIMCVAFFHVHPVSGFNRPPLTRNMRSEVMEGLRYVLNHRLIRLLLAMAITVAVLARGVMELLPAFADGIFGRGAVGLAMLTSASGAGAIVAGLWLSRGTALPLTRVAGLAAIANGVLVVGFGQAPRFDLALALAAAIGFSFSCFGISLQSLLQTHVDENFRGRVSSYWGMFGIGGSAIGAALLGALAPVWGLQWVAAWSGLACVLVSAYLVWRLRSGGDVPAGSLREHTAGGG